MLTIGLMSGTSLDGVDAVLLESGPGAGDPLRALAHAWAPMPGALRAEFLALNASGPDEIHRGALAANALADLYAAVVRRLLDDAGVDPSAIAAVGAHGQTVRHRPELGYTVQLAAPARLAEACGIAVVADFRSRDVAAGGQGAPLVPSFHRALFGRPGEDLAVLNLGGIANLSLLHADGRLLGFDTGPANALLDLWAQRHLGTAYDAGGAWSAGGVVHSGLLERLLGDAYFSAPPPKSTGRDHFDAAWLSAALAEHAAVDARDVQATLAELTAASAAAELRRHLPQAGAMLVCGGGAGNADLMRRLAARLPEVEVQTTSARGVPPEQVEAAAFAWLAALALQGRIGNWPEVTGARGPRVLGAIYPA